MLLAAVPRLEITELRPSPPVISMLSDILQAVVEGGGSVGFMHPLSREAAESFWDKSLSAAARNERIVLGAWEGEILTGTVTLLLDCPPNQPHRGEIAKLMTHPAYRGRGVASALMRAAEDLAVKRGRTLLVLDTATDGGASSLYERLGWILAGEIPDYALKPHGGLTGTKLYWKGIGERAV
jgi:ribosomal protein S18 acetylase RimI-like enzyme